MFGFINAYKPTGMTSFDVVGVLRKILKIKQIGHAGTLDPEAEGVLPIAVGKATRLLEYLSDEKAYIANVQFGKISTTYDKEGTISDFSDKKISLLELQEKKELFLGEIEQLPPVYSAVHYKGKRLYELAREGKELPEDVEKRKVFVEKFSILEFDEVNQTAKIEIYCSKGTYIRSIVHDIGQECGVGAYMTGLVRVLSSGFKVEQSIELEELKKNSTEKNILTNPLEVLSLVQIELDDEEKRKVLHGQTISCNIELESGCLVALKQKNELVAIAKTNGKMLKVEKVFGI